MKHIKLLLSISVLFASLNLSAQKKLTNREIYDFNVGDIIHTMYAFPSPPEYVKRKFLSKQLSANQDTLIFEVLDTIYKIKIPNWQMTVENNVIKYHTLDSFPKPFDQYRKGGAFLLAYSASGDSCGTINNYNFTNAPDTIIILDREHYSRSYVEGLGNYFVNQYQTGIYEYYQLEYYKKAGKCEGGERIGNLATSSWMKINLITIFPNPSTNEIYINGIDHGFYEIYDIYGRSILKGNINSSIDTHQISAGIYMLLVNSNGILYSAKLIKQ